MGSPIEKVNSPSPDAPFGFEISKDNDGYISLTDLWKAAGSNENNRPAHWMQIDETKGFIKAWIASTNTLSMRFMIMW